jgi:hypothetical protein
MPTLLTWLSPDFRPFNMIGVRKDVPMWKNGGEEYYHDMGGEGAMVP